MEARTKFHDDITYRLIANEDWARNFKRDGESFDLLVKAEARMQRNLRRYFRELADERVENLINWPLYRRKLRADSMVPEDQMEREVAEILIVVEEPLEQMFRAGALAQSKFTGIGDIITPQHERVLEFARRRSNQLVTNINRTTKKRLQKSLTKGIQNKETRAEATDRIRKVVKDPRRADMIARTESVSSYTEGTLAYGEETGAKKKEWDLSFDPCPICTEIAGRRNPIPFDDEFHSGVLGKKLPGAPAHPNCRCGVIILYD